MTRTRFTSADLDLLPIEEGKRYEIIDGELYVTKQPTTEHQMVCHNISVAVGVWSDETGLGYIVPAPGVIFADDDDVAPDLVWVSKGRMSQILGPDRHMHAAPEIVIEVLSPGATNQRRDREVKLGLYNRREVPEYWITDWQRRELLVHRRQGGTLLLAATLRGDDILTSPLLPGFSTPVSRFFANLPL